MNPIPASLTIGAIVALAKWRKGEMIAIENVIGVTGVALTLAVIAQLNRDLARSFGALAVVGVSIVQVPPLLNQTFGD